MNHRQKKKHEKKLAAFFSNMENWAKTVNRAKIISQEAAEEYRRTQISQVVNTAIILTGRRKIWQTNRWRAHIK